MKEIKGDLVYLAQHDHFDLITHGCNCFCTMGSGIAPQIANAFPETRIADNKTIKGDISKLGKYSSAISRTIGNNDITIVNSYTQYGFDPKKRQLEYGAIRSCMMKINNDFKTMHIGIPLIGCGLAGGDWNIVKQIIQEELTDIYVTIVHYEK